MLIPVTPPFYLTTNQRIVHELISLSAIPLPHLAFKKLFSEILVAEMLLNSFQLPNMMNILHLYFIFLFLLHLTLSTASSLKF